MIAGREGIKAIEVCERAMEDGGQRRSLEQGNKMSVLLHLPIFELTSADGGFLRVCRWQFLQINIVHAL